MAGQSLENEQSKQRNDTVTDYSKSFVQAINTL